MKFPLVIFNPNTEQIVGIFKNTHKVRISASMAKDKSTSKPDFELQQEGKVFLCTYESSIQKWIYEKFAIEQDGSWSKLERKFFNRWEDSEFGTIVPTYDVDLVYTHLYEKVDKLQSIKKTLELPWLDGGQNYNRVFVTYMTPQEATIKLD